MFGRKEEIKKEIMENKMNDKKTIKNIHAWCKTHKITAAILCGFIIAIIFAICVAI